MKQYKVDNVVLLSIGYHLPRVKRLAKIVAIAVKNAIKPDSILSQASGIYHVYARTFMYKTSSSRSLEPLLRTVSSYFLEGTGWILMILDPKSKHIAKLTTTKIRHNAQVSLFPLNLRLNFTF